MKCVEGHLKLSVTEVERRPLDIRQLRNYYLRFDGCATDDGWDFQEEKVIIVWKQECLGFRVYPELLLSGSARPQDLWNKIDKVLYAQVKMQPFAMSLQSLCVLRLKVQDYVEVLASSSQDLTVEITVILSHLSGTQLAQLESSARDACDSVRLPQAGNLAYTLLRLTEMKLQSIQLELRKTKLSFEKVRVIIAYNGLNETRPDYHHSSTVIVELPAHMVLDTDHQMFQRLSQMPVILWDRYDAEGYAVLSRYKNEGDATTYGVSIDTERLHCLFGKLEWSEESKLSGYDEDRNCWKAQYDAATVMSSWAPYNHSDNDQDEDPDEYYDYDDHNLRFMRSNPAVLNGQPCVAYFLRCFNDEPGYHNLARYVQTDKLLKLTAMDLHGEKCDDLV